MRLVGFYAMNWLSFLMPRFSLPAYCHVIVSSLSLSLPLCCLCVCVSTFCLCWTNFLAGSGYTPTSNDFYELVVGYVCSSLSSTCSCKVIWYIYMHFYCRCVTSMEWCIVILNQRTFCLQTRRKHPPWRQLILGCQYSSNLVLHFIYWACFMHFFPHYGLLYLSLPSLYYVIYY